VIRPPAVRLPATLACLVLLASVAPGVAAAQGAPPVAQACASAESALALSQTMRSLDAGRAEEALAAARALVARCPQLAAAQHALARAQLTLGRPLAAIEALRAFLVVSPGDCETRSWLAWIRLQQGEATLAARELDEQPCPVSAGDAGRYLWLRAHLAAAAGDRGGARRALSALGDRGVLHHVDRAAWNDLNRQLRPGWEPPLAASAELALGGASHALAATPTDRPGENVSSGVGRPSLRLAWRAPELRRLTPFADLALNANGLSAAEARGFSVLDGSLRLGTHLGGLGGRAPRLAYAHDELLLNDRARTRYSVADRGELALAPSARLALQVSLGRRRFPFEQGRSRTELEGVGLLKAFGGRLPLQLGASWRFFPARESAYDQLGGTLMATTDVPLGRRIRGRGMVLVAHDRFPHSGGPEGLTAFGSEAKRRDTLVRASVGLWVAPRANARLGLEYERAQRFSSADQPSFYYPYTAHRVLFRVRVDRSGNPWRARAPVAETHVPLWTEAEGALTPQGFDPALLRQDVELQGDCGCAVP
jgi:hypothetical protein